MLQEGELNMLQKKQNQVLRTILKCNRYTRIKDMLHCTNLLSVRQTIILNTMVVVYKIKNDMYPRHLVENLQYVSEIHQHGTRNRMNFYVPTVKSSFAQNCVFNKGLVEFNKLPEDIKSADYNNFKKLLRKYIVDRYPI